MKKLVLLLIGAAILTGCSSSGYSVKVTDSNKTIVSINGMTITKQDYFERLLDDYGSSQILSDALTAIADKEITDQDEINKLLKEREKLYSQYADGDLESYAQSMGFESKDEYINQALLPDVKQELLRNHYIEKNYDSLLTEYTVTCIKKIIVDKESTALSIIKASTSEDAFDKQMEKYSDNAEDAGIVTKNTTLDENLMKKLGDFSKMTKDGVYSEAIKLSDDSYAVVYVYDTQRKDKSKYIDTLTSDSDLQEEIEGIYLKKYHFTVNDSKLKDAIKKLSSEYIE